MTIIQNSSNNKSRFIYNSDDMNSNIRNYQNNSSTDKISLLSPNINNVFSEKWNPDIKKDVTFFNDFELPVWLFPINSVKQFLLNSKMNESHFKTKSIIENKLKTLLSNDFRDCSLYSLGVTNFSNGFLRFLIICCSKGVIITDTSLISNNKYFNDSNNSNDINDCIHDFLRFISNSAEVVSTNISSSLHVIESLYQVKLGIRNIDTVDSFISFLRSSQNGPNWKTIYTHQVHDFPTFDNNFSFNVTHLFSVLDVISIAHRTVASYFYSTNICEDSAVFIAHIPIMNSQKYPPNDQLIKKSSIYDKGQQKITIERPDEDKKKIELFKNIGKNNLSNGNESIKSLNNADNTKDIIRKEEINSHEMVRLPFTLPVAPSSNDPTLHQQIQQPVLTLIPGKNMHKIPDGGSNKNNIENSKPASDSLHPAPFSLLPSATSHAQPSTAPLSLLPSDNSSQQKKQQNQIPFSNLMLLPKSKPTKHASPSTSAVSSNINFSSKNNSTTIHSASNSPPTSNSSLISSVSIKTTAGSSSPSSASQSTSTNRTISSENTQNSSSISNTTHINTTNSNSLNISKASLTTPIINFTNTSTPSKIDENSKVITTKNQSDSSTKIQIQKALAPKITLNKNQDSYMMTTKMSPRRGSQSPPHMVITMSDKEIEQLNQNNHINNKCENSINATSANNNYDRQRNTTTNNNFVHNNYNNRTNSNNNFVHNNNNNNNYFAHNGTKNNNFVHNNNNISTYNKNNNFNHNNNNYSNSNNFNNDNNNNFLNKNNKGGNNFVYNKNNGSTNTNSNLVHNNNGNNNNNNYYNYNGNQRNRNNSFNEKFHYRSPSVDNDTQQNKLNSDNQNSSNNSSNSNYYNSTNNRRFGSSSLNNRFFYSKSNDTDTNNNKSSTLSNNNSSNEQKEKEDTTPNKTQNNTTENQTENIENQAGTNEKENKPTNKNEIDNENIEKKEKEVPDKTESSKEENNKDQNKSENNENQPKEEDQTQVQKETTDEVEITERNASFTIVNDDFWNKLRHIEASLASESVIQTVGNGFKCTQCDIVSHSFSGLMQHCWEFHNNLISEE